MRTKHLLAICVAVAILYVAGARAMRSHWFADIATNRQATKTITIENGNEKLAYVGSVRLNDAGTAIDSMSPDGHLFYSDGHRRVEIRPDKNGGLTYRFDGTTDKMPGDSALLTAAVRALLNNEPDGDDRLHRVYTRGGYQAVLDHIDLLGNDAAKMAWCSYLLGSDSLTTEQLVELTHKINTQIRADQHKTALLMQWRKEQLRSDTSLKAYAHAVNSLRASIDKNRVLEYIRKQGVTLQ